MNEVLPAELQPGDVLRIGKRRGAVRRAPGAGWKELGSVLIQYSVVHRDGRVREERLETYLNPKVKVVVLSKINLESDNKVASDVSPQGQKESSIMAKVPVKKAGKAKAGAKGGTATKDKATRTRRSAEDVDAMVEAFVEHLQGGGTMRDLKAEHGFSDDGPIRAALYRNGYDSKGNEHGVEADTIDAGKVAGKKALVKMRSEGAAWYALAYVAGISEAEAKAIVADAGGETGRVYTKVEKEDKAKAKAKTPAAKRKAAKEAEEDPS